MPWILATAGERRIRLDNPGRFLRAYARHGLARINREDYRRGIDDTVIQEAIDRLRAKGDAVNGDLIEAWMRGLITVPWNAAAPALER